MKLYQLILGILILGNISLQAQSISDFTYLNGDYEDELLIGLAFSNTFGSNNDAPNAEAHKLKGYSWEVNMRKVRLGTGEVSWRWQHKLLGDMTILVRDIFKDNSNYYRKENSGLTSGYLGWWNWTWNLHKPQKHLISAGFNLHDYFLTSSYHVDSLPENDDLISLEPQGYYFSAGPSLAAQYQVSDWLLMETVASYSLSYWRAVSLTYALEDNDYPKPHWGQLNLGLISKWGFYADMNYNWVINRGDLPNNTKRFDILLGFRFRV